MAFLKIDINKVGVQSVLLTIGHICRDLTRCIQQYRCSINTWLDEVLVCRCGRELALPGWVCLLKLEGCWHPLLKHKGAPPFTPSRPRWSAYLHCLSKPCHRPELWKGWGTSKCPLPPQNTNQEQWGREEMKGHSENEGLSVGKNRGVERREKEKNNKNKDFMKSILLIQYGLGQEVEVAMGTV